REQRARRLADRWYAGYSGEYLAVGDVNLSEPEEFATIRQLGVRVRLLASRGQRLDSGIRRSMIVGCFPTTGDRTVRAGFFAARQRVYGLGEAVALAFSLFAPLPALPAFTSTSFAVMV